MILFLLAWRNLWSHKVKSLIVGFLMFFGTVVVTTGGAVIESMDGTMQESIVASVAGHVQVSAKKAPDALALFGSMMLSRDDVGFVPDFSTLKQKLLTDPNVKTVVPMAIDMVQVVGGNDFDRLLQSLRDALATKDTVLTEQIVALTQEAIAELARVYKEQKQFLRLSADEEVAVHAMEQASAPAFWQKFVENPMEQINFLDNHVARHADQFDMPIYMRYLATEPQLFARSFSKFEIIAGENIPQGQRGFLFNKKFYNDFFRNRVINNLEKLREAVAKNDKIAGNPKLKSYVDTNVREYMRIIMRILPGKMPAFDAALKRTGVAGTSRAEQLKNFLAMDDSTVLARLNYFDSFMRSLLREHEVQVGDNIAIRSLTRSGYMRTVNAKVYGVFHFKGIDRSEIAGTHNIIDLETFRSLYGFMTQNNRDEVAEIRAGAHVREVKRESAEAELFGDAQEPKQNKVEESIEDAREPVLNAALLLRNPREQNQTIARLNAEYKDIKAVGWQEASGIVGQFVVIVRGVLMGASALVFLAALVIINNSMIISTLERTQEIGTMRAIGAGRSFVLSLIFTETLILGFIVGVLSFIASVLIVGWLHRVGIPAVSDQLAFLFGGDRLYPTLGSGNVLLGFGAVVVVSLLGSFYPALIASGVRPIVAMQAKE